jgi:hypothetical protein
MSWKNTQQNSFADSLVIEHKSLSELDDVHNIINWGEMVVLDGCFLADWWFFGWVMQRSLMNIINYGNNLH